MPPNDGRPLTEIAIELGLTRKYLIYWFQQEFELISQKHKRLISHKALQKRKEQISRVEYHLASSYKRPLPKHIEK